MRPTFRLMVLGSLLTASSAAQPASEFLSRLDGFARTFTGVQATISYTQHSKVLGDDVPQTGTLTIQRYAPGKLRFRIDLTGTDAHTISLREHIAEVYYPKIDEIQEWDIRKYRDIAQTLLALGLAWRGVISRRIMRSVV